MLIIKILLRSLAFKPIKMIKLIKQCILYSNKIFSLDVATKALQGKFIEIHKNTSVDALSVIGSYTYIGQSCLVTKAKIGRYVSIANNVSIGPGEHDLNRVSTSALFYDNPYETLTSDKCTIESDVWIGVDAVILRGVRLGIGCVVAANSVVTKDIPNFAIVAGSPAKIIRYRFDEGLQQKIVESSWWEKDLEEAKYLINGITIDPHTNKKL